MNIRPAEITDNIDIAKIHRESIMVTNKNYYTEQELNWWIGNRTFDDYTEMIKKGNVFVAEENGIIVGFSNIDLERNRIKAVYVYPEFERRGIGKLLLDKLIKFAKEKNKIKLSLNSSEAAKNFYIKNGFRLIEKVEHKCRLEGTISGYFMEIEL